MSQCIVVHGGAAKIPNDKISFKMEGINKAVQKGYDVLCKEEGTALDAVEAAVVAMENDPYFNAGTGSCLTIEGSIEMDALIMEGKTMKAGAVAGISKIKNPISLARQIMEQSDHVFMIGEGAHQFASSKGIPLVPNQDLVTQWSKERLDKYHTFNNAIRENMKPLEHDTVGAVAIDKYGNLACATSTGGITAKLVGRVGDSPIIGAGGLADNQLGAVSTTGHGEAIMRASLSSRILNLIEAGKTAQEAAQIGIDFMEKRIKGTGGAIVVDLFGNIGIYFSTEHMVWAAINSGNLSSGYKL